MAAQQGVNCTNGLFMKEENPAGGNKTSRLCFSQRTSTSRPAAFQMKILLNAQHKLSTSFDSYQQTNTSLPFSIWIKDERQL